MAAKVNAMWMLSLDTTPAYIEALHVKSIFTSHTRSPVTFDHHSGQHSPSPRISNAIPMLCISSTKGSLQSMLTLFIMFSIACATYLRIYPIFVCCLPDPSIDGHQNYTSFPQDKWDPPCKCRLIIYPLQTW